MVSLFSAGLIAVPVFVLLVLPVKFKLPPLVVFTVYVNSSSANLYCEPNKNEIGITTTDALLKDPFCMAGKVYPATANVPATTVLPLSVMTRASALPAAAL